MWTLLDGSRLPQQCRQMKDLKASHCRALSRIRDSGDGDETAAIRQLQPMAASRLPSAVLEVSRTGRPQDHTKKAMCRSLARLRIKTRPLARLLGFIRIVHRSGTMLFTQSPRRNTQLRRLGQRFGSLVDIVLATVGDPSKLQTYTAAASSPIPRQQYRQ